MPSQLSPFVLFFFRIHYNPGSRKLIGWFFVCWYLYLHFRSLTRRLILASQRESWQDIGTVNASKAEVASFGLELSKKLDMRYRSPPLPVNLNMMQGGDQRMMPFMEVDPMKMAMQDSSDKPAGRHIHSASDLDSIMAMFEKDSK